VTGSEILLAGGIPALELEPQQIIRLARDRSSEGGTESQRRFAELAKKYNSKHPDEPAVTGNQIRLAGGIPALELEPQQIIRLAREQRSEGGTKGGKANSGLEENTKHYGIVQNTRGPEAGVIRGPYRTRQTTEQKVRQFITATLNKSNKLIWLSERTLVRCYGRLCEKNKNWTKSINATEAHKIYMEYYMYHIRHDDQNPYEKAYLDQQEREFDDFVKFSVEPTFTDGEKDDDAMEL
jgi:hypothetical protein